MRQAGRKREGEGREREFEQEREKGEKEEKEKVGEEGRRLKSLKNKKDNKCRRNLNEWMKRKIIKEWKRVTKTEEKAYGERKMK